MPIPMLMLMLSYLPWGLPTRRKCSPFSWVVEFTRVPALGLRFSKLSGQCDAGAGGDADADADAHGDAHADAHADAFLLAMGGCPPVGECSPFSRIA